MILYWTKNKIVPIGWKKEHFGTCYKLMRSSKNTNMSDTTSVDLNPGTAKSCHDHEGWKNVGLIIDNFQNKFFEFQKGGITRFEVLCNGKSSILGDSTCIYFRKKKHLSNSIFTGTFKKYIYIFVCGCTKYSTSSLFSTRLRNIYFQFRFCKIKHL